ncbi:uncharacterized protein BXIN_2152 [Babesia sp. Xinjiang]|uniref:uncharacterized protein n=1 Tax=Babesia sp. Xinjiang TaxID=462227 RepID=UPI000A263469|nr:uncharacterized protein BXIN_2152 [Babesia sp. Xinjiang]ORM40481.1 hypothetical protein BXIN_2152 [Babesia sp. Xinjiang]
MIGTVSKMSVVYAILSLCVAECARVSFYSVGFLLPNDPGGYRPALRRRSVSTVASRALPLMASPMDDMAVSDLDSDFESDNFDADDGKDITESDIAEMLQLIKDVKQGKLGPKWKQDMEDAEAIYNRNASALEKHPWMSDDSPKPDVTELLKERDEFLEKQLNEVFDISGLEHPTEEEIERSLEMMKSENTNDVGGGEPDNSEVSGDEEYFQNVADGKLRSEELKKLVHSFYREKGMLNEPVVRTTVDRFRLHWRQNKHTFDIWFPCVSPDDEDNDYSVKFMPQELTITYKGTPFVLKLRGKVDVDGCFWCMQELPDVGKVVGMVLRKRVPAYSGTWAHLLSVASTALREP